MDNPYAPPQARAVSPTPTITARRALLWAVLIYCAVVGVAAISTFSVEAWVALGATPQAALAQLNLTQSVLCGATGAGLYWRFAARTPRSKALNVLLVYVIVQVIDIAIASVLVGMPLDEWLDPWGTAETLSSALLGLGLASLGSNNSFKPKPLRGSA